MKSDVIPPQPGSSDEKAPDSSENGINKNKGGWPKGKKRKSKTPKDALAPKHPLTGYVRYMNERRDALRNEKPGVGFAEVTRLLAEEWGALPATEKKQYLDAAEQDRERYAKEIDEYKQNSEKKAAIPVPLQAIPKTNIIPVQPHTKLEKQADFSSEFDIPIFTEEFLEHNKVREAELRQLRKSNTDYEQQNAILQKHIENMRSGIDKLEAETTAQKQNNGTLEIHLEKLRNVLIQGFRHVPLDGLNGATPENIDSYMSELQKSVLVSNPAGITIKARDIISRLDLPMH